MTTESTSAPRSLGAVMSSEAGFEPEVDDAPLRISGFIALILGLVSGLTIVAVPMVGAAIAAVLFGLFALRKSSSQSIPVGTTAAKAGILLAVLFGSWGVARYALKVDTLGDQAEYFARQFVRVASSGNEAYAAELQKSYVNRYLKTMPLEERYEQRQKELERERQEAMEQGSEFAGEEEDTTVADLQKYPVDHPWRLWRPVRVFSQFGRQKAEVILAADDSDKPFRLLVKLEYLINKESGVGEWHVDRVTPYRERIVAESIL